jgi:hypothetical protein
LSVERVDRPSKALVIGIPKTCGSACRMTNRSGGIKGSGA